MKLFSEIKSKIAFIIKRLRFSRLKYWEDRAKKYGALSVLNLNHTPEELSTMNDLQKKIIFPLLEKELLGTEKTLLDFGCGPGRFSADLSELTGCYVTAVDPIDHLLHIAPRSASVSYKKLIGNKIPAANKSFDIIWICLVLGGIISKKKLSKTITELNRVAKENALFFIIENTADLKGTLTWKYRSVKEYILLFETHNLVHFKDYEDVGERISIFAGRSNVEQK